ncbi:MAG TPA: signal peptidase II [Candidatus Mediterraneibacter intestinavium]|nr:signal peptidase II [Candidatus Mediterraneibacter intestinavium]
MKRLWFLGESAVLFGADQLMKTYVEQNFDRGEEKKLTDRIVLRRVHNRGMCLNLLEEEPGAVKYLSLFSASVLTLVYALSLMRKKGFWRKKGLALMAAGAWSNTFDRCARGHVVDYIGFRSENKKISDVTYNLGDFFIAAGGVTALLASLSVNVTSKKKNGRKSRAEEEPAEQ